VQQTQAKLANDLQKPNPKYKISQQLSTR